MGTLCFSNFTAHQADGLPKSTSRISAF
jgi:hypothetical protein